MSRWEQRRVFTARPFRVVCRHPEHGCRVRSFTSYVTAYAYWKQADDRGCDPYLVESGTADSQPEEPM